MVPVFAEDRPFGLAFPDIVHGVVSGGGAGGVGSVVVVATVEVPAVIVVCVVAIPVVDVPVVVVVPVAVVVVVDPPLVNSVNLRITSNQKGAPNPARPTVNARPMIHPAHIFQSERNDQSG